MAFRHLIASRFRVFLFLLLLCLAAYWPTLSQPFIEDDFSVITLASTWFGAPQQIGVLFNAPIMRFRATQNWELWAVRRSFGLHPAAFYAVGILLHAINCLLLFELVRVAGFRPFAFLTASIFAIAEGHQEALMWISGGTELLLFLFGISAIVCWVRF